MSLSPTFLASFLLLLVAVSHGAFVNPGTPNNIPEGFDCKARTAAYEFGKKLLPKRGSFKTLFDALQLGNGCGMTSPVDLDEWSPPGAAYYPPPPANAFVVHVDASNGSDGASGAEAAPVRSIHEALRRVERLRQREQDEAGSGKAAGRRPAVVLLRAGVHFVGTTVHVGPEHTGGSSGAGLTIMNYEGERATVSGGTPIKLAKSDWKAVKVTPPGSFTPFVGWNNVYGRVPTARADAPGVKYLGQVASLAACEKKAASSSSSSSSSSSASLSSFKAVTWHHTDFMDKDFAGGCYGTLVAGGTWAPVKQAGVDSAKSSSQNLWSADLSAWAKSHPNVTSILGLRLNTRRSIRAKYPDGDPEKSGQWFVSTDPGMGNGQYTAGWVTSQTDWVTPERRPDAEEVVVTGKDWPGVHWPATQEGGSGWTGEGDWGDFHIALAEWSAWCPGTAGEPWWSEMLRRKTLQ
eukprot:g3707.t1